MGDRKVQVGVNDLLSCFPGLAAEWVSERNGELAPDKVHVGSALKVWWVCSEGHEWLCEVRQRVKGVECSVCSNRVLLAGFNDLATVNPVLASEWHPTRNEGLLPSMVFPRSGRKVWWACEAGHEWEATVDHRAGKNAGCPVCSGRYPDYGVTDLATVNPALASEWHPTKNEGLLPSMVSYGSRQMVWWVCSEGHEWRSEVVNRHAGRGCPVCHVGRASRSEVALAEFVEGLGFVVERNNRKVIAPYEIDVYVPEKKLGVEFNGLYWHSDVAPQRLHGLPVEVRHHRKWVLSEAVGVRLIQVWEDDWVERPEQVKALLRRQLGVDRSESVYARNTVPVVLTAREAYPFLNKYHLRGKARGSVYAGLRDIETGVLVVVGVFLRVGMLWRLERYATSTRVPGGFTKLLAYVRRLNPGLGGVYTFSDHCVSDGGLYEQNGFVVDKVLPPDYMYVVGNRREHKFRYRLKRFREDPDLVYQEGLTEQELAKLNRLHRVWDAGKTRWLLRWS